MHMQISSKYFFKDMCLTPFGRSVSGISYFNHKILTLYKAASDPTYLKRRGAESARTSVLGPRCPERPNDDSLLNF